MMLLGMVGPAERAVLSSRNWRPVVEPAELEILARAAGVAAAAEPVLAFHDGTQYWLAFAAGLKVISRGHAELWDEMARRVAHGEQPLLFVRAGRPPAHPHRRVWAGGRFEIVRVLALRPDKPAQPGGPPPLPGPPPAGDFVVRLFWTTIQRMVFLPAWLSGLLPLPGPARYLSYLGLGLGLTALGWGFAAGRSKRVGLGRQAAAKGVSAGRQGL